MAILGPHVVGLLDAIGPMPSGCTNSPPSSFQSTLSDIFTCLKANFFQFFLESCNPMVVLAIVCVAPAHPAATMQWARLWGHVGAHNEFFLKGCQNSTSWRMPMRLGRSRRPHLHAYGGQVEGRGAAVVQRTLEQGGRISFPKGGGKCSPGSSPSICPDDF